MAIEKWSPYERERWLAGRLASGEDPKLVDAAREVLGSGDREVLAGLCQWSRLVVDSFRSEHAAALAALPPAVAAGLIVEATVAYLFGYGLMVPAPAGGPGWHPREWRDAVPEHLHPDVDGAVAAHQRVLDRLPGRRYG